MFSLETLFHTEVSKRDKFLSRLFGIFNEEIVRIWCDQPEAEFEDLGRPTLKKKGQKQRFTLDFTFRSRRDQAVFIAEMKCELEFQNYKYLTLNSACQLTHHSKKKAFEWFQLFATSPELFEVTCKNRESGVGTQIGALGAILIWGGVAEDAKELFLQETRFSRVLSIERMICDLQEWQSEKYQEFVALREQWCGQLFLALRGVGGSDGSTARTHKERCNPFGVDGGFRT